MGYVFLVISILFDASVLLFYLTLFCSIVISTNVEKSLRYSLQLLVTFAV